MAPAGGGPVLGGVRRQRKLRTLGIRTIGDLAAADRGLMKQHLKNTGNLSGTTPTAGIPPPFAGTAENKGYGNSMTVPMDVTDADTGPPGHPFPYGDSVRQAAGGWDEGRLCGHIHYGPGFQACLAPEDPGLVHPYNP